MRRCQRSSQMILEATTANELPHASPELTERENLLWRAKEDYDELEREFRRQAMEPTVNRDSTGNVPRPRSPIEALRAIRKIASDKRSHVMLADHCGWLELKLRVCGLLAKRGLRASRPRKSLEPRSDIKLADAAITKGRIDE